MPPAIIPFIPLIASGIAGAGSVLSNTKGARTSTSTPTVSPEYAPLQQQLLKIAMERLNNPGGLPKGYEEAGISGINQTYPNIEQSIKNRLSSQGLFGSPVAGNALSNLQLQRGGDISRFETSLPWLAEQFKDKYLNTGMQLLNQGMGTTNVGAGSAAGAGLGSLGTMFGYMSGAGAFPGGPETYGTPPIFGGAGTTGPYSDTAGQPDWSRILRRG